MRNDGPSLQGSMRVAALDAVRGIAILMVVAVHSIWIQPDSILTTLAYRGLSGLSLGVDLFFVLSGYLITGILIRSRGEPGYFGRFYLSRALRILPAYYLVLAAVWVLLPKVDPSVADAHLSSYTGFYVLHLQNWLLALTPQSSGWVGANHFWSLGVEEQFYLMWPMVVLLTPPHALRRLCLALIAGCLAAKAALIARHAGWSVIYMSTLTRLDGLAAGALVATMSIAEARRIADGVGKAGLAAGALIVLIVLGTADRHDALRAATMTSLAALAFGAAILRVHADARAWTGQVLQSPLLIWFGRYSYGLYLVHLPIVFVLRDWAVRNGVLSELPGLARTMVFAAATFALSVIVARALYALLEQPALQLRDWLLYGGEAFRRTRRLIISTTTANPIAK